MNKREIVIRTKDVRQTQRIPLPRQTGGRHKDTLHLSRQEAKAKLRRGEW